MPSPASAAALGAILLLAPRAAAQGQLNVIDSAVTNEFLGATLVRFHDLDGDGWREFLAGSPGSSPGGRVTVLSGRYLASTGGSSLTNALRFLIHP